MLLSEAYSGVSACGKGACYKDQLESHRALRTDDRKEFCDASLPYFESALRRAGSNAKRGLVGAALNFIAKLGERTPYRMSLLCAGELPSARAIAGCIVTSGRSQGAKLERAKLRPQRAALSSRIVFEIFPFASPPAVMAGGRAGTGPTLSPSNAGGFIHSRHNNTRMRAGVANSDSQAKSGAGRIATPRVSAIVTPLPVFIAPSSATTEPRTSTAKPGSAAEAAPIIGSGPLCEKKFQKAVKLTNPSQERVSFGAGFPWYASCSPTGMCRSVLRPGGSPRNLESKRHRAAMDLGRPPGAKAQRSNIDLAYPGEAVSLIVGNNLSERWRSDRREASWPPGVVARPGFAQRRVPLKCLECCGPPEA